MPAIEQRLVSWGFDDWFQSQVEPGRLDAFDLARVVAVHKQSYMVQGARGESSAEITGKLMYSADSPLDYPTVGDWVYAQFFDGHEQAIIHGILPRKTVLRRKTPGKRVQYQLLAANLDTALIMQAMGRDFNPRRLERYLAICHEAAIAPVVLLNKCETASDGEIDSALAQTAVLSEGVRTMAISALSGAGLDELRAMLAPGRTFCLLGSSGVGKTTLLNRLLGREEFSTQAIRAGDGKGRHTTTRRELARLASGALVMDTPGMRELGTASLERGIAGVFEEIEALAQDCRFGDCSHTREQGCAILKALEDGALSQSRYHSFMKMRRESEFFQSSYREKRQKDKQFGSMVKEVIRKSVKKPR